MSRRGWEVPVILNRNKYLASRTTRAFTAIVAAAIVLFAVSATAQTDTRRDGKNADIAGADTMDGSARAAVVEARRQLEAALSSDQDNLRWDALREARQLREEWIGQIVIPYCDSPNLTEQVLALEAVAETDPKLGRDVFLEQLNHQQRSVRLRALLGLERAGDPDDAFEIVRVMEHDPDIDLRAVAARALGALGNPEASSSLRRKVTSHHAPLREQAVLALLKIGTEDVGEYLMDLLEADRDLDVFASMRLLALVPDPALIGRLKPYLDSEDSMIRTHASITILAILERSRAGTP